METTSMKVFGLSDFRNQSVFPNHSHFRNFPQSKTKSSKEDGKITRKSIRGTNGKNDVLWCGWTNETYVSLLRGRRNRRARAPGPPRFWQIRYKATFTNYVDEKRWVGSPKMSHRYFNIFKVENVTVGGWSKKPRTCQCSLWTTLSNYSDYVHS